MNATDLDEARRHKRYKIIYSLDPGEIIEAINTLTAGESQRLIASLAHWEPLRAAVINSLALDEVAAATAALVDHTARASPARAEVITSLTPAERAAIVDEVEREREDQWRAEDEARDRQRREQREAEFAEQVSTLANYGQPWTEDHLDVLRNPWLKNAECARILERTVSSVTIARKDHKIGRSFGGRIPRPPADHPERLRALQQYAEQLAARPHAVEGRGRL